MKLFTLLFVALLLSCASTPNNKKKPINPDPVVTIEFPKLKFDDTAVLKLSDIADSISYISLSNDILLSEIGYIKQAKNNNFIILSNNMVYQYDQSGKYINRLFNSGRGPQDAICLTKPIINSERKYITVDDNFSQFYKKYSFYGNYISKEQKTENEIHKNIVGYIDAFEISYNKDNLYMTSSDSCNIYGDYLMYVKNTDTNSDVYKMVNPYKDFRLTPKAKGGAVSIEERFMFVQDTKNGILFNIADIDTIYQTTDFKNVRAKYILKYNNPKRDFLATMMRTVGHSDKTKGDYISFAKAVLGDRYFLFSFFKGLSSTIVCYDTSTGSLHEFSIIKNDIDELADIDMWMGIIQCSQNEDKLYIPIDAVTITDNGKADNFQGLTENSNPVIMVIHLKR